MVDLQGFGSPTAHALPATAMNPSPVTHLHFDLLALIFVGSLPEIHVENDVAPPSNRQAPMNVSHVCRTWRDAALVTAQLWTRIYFNLSECQDQYQMIRKSSAVNAFMERSASCGLVINVECHSRSHFDVAEDWRMLGELIVRPIFKARSRWRMVRIIYPSAAWQMGYSKATDWVLDNCTDLERLDLRLTHARGVSMESRGAGLMKFDISVCEHLRNLRLGDTSSILINCSVLPVLKNLTRLQIDKRTTYRSVDVTTAILANSPNLEDVRLRQPCGGNSNPHEDLISLTNLRRLQLGERVRLFGIRSIVQAMDGGFENILDQIIAPSLQELKLFTIEGNVNVDRVVGHACEFLQRSSFPLKKFVLECNGVQDANLVVCLQSLPLVEDIDLMVWNEDVDTLLDRLTIRPATEELGRICPLLSTMTIRHSSPGRYTESISRMLLSRSPIDDERYPTEQSRSGTMGRHGTNILRSFKILYSWVVNELDAQFTVDGGIANLIDRGLDFDARARPDQFEASDEN